MSSKVLFPGVKDGDTFQVGGMEFIKFPSVGGKVPAVSKDILFRSQFGRSNNLAASSVLEKLKNEVLPKIIEVVGEDAVCTFKTDLTTLDGLKPYEALESQISLPTFDSYRENVSIFDKYPAANWWWLATPESAKPHDNPDWVLCVAPSGGIYYVRYFGNFGVRPFLFFDSSIFGSFDSES